MQNRSRRTPPHVTHTATMASTHVQPLLGQEDMTRELSLGFDKIVKYMQVREKDRSTLRRRWLSAVAAPCLV